MKVIASNLFINHSVETMAKREAFISLKDHKENFLNNSACILINPAKSKFAKISKVLVLNKIKNTKITNIKRVINVHVAKSMEKLPSSN